MRKSTNIGHHILAILGLIAIVLMLYIPLYMMVSNPDTFIIKLSSEGGDLLFIGLLALYLCLGFPAVILGIFIGLVGRLYAVGYMLIMITFVIWGTLITQRFAMNDTFVLASLLSIPALGLFSGGLVFLLNGRRKKRKTITTLDDEDY